MAGKLDPFDVEALERSVNDSAVRVSTIWVSFLIFALYLVVSAGTITHRQLFLEEPVKLPVLNIDLPLWGFFFLAPILFVIFHAYVLLQVLLLGRTAAAYNAAVDRAVKPPTGNASMRQRLANTLFAQIFAGSPREREGLLGFLLKLMAWVTLTIAPVLLLLVFQFKFLPYHSHPVTWIHRFLILLELVTVFLLWPLVLDAQRDIDWLRVLRQPITSITVILFVCTSWLLGTFPGEPHVNLFTASPRASDQCDRWFHRKLNFVDLRFDRLILPRVDVVDDEKLAKIENATTAKGAAPSAGERTRNFRDRDLTCGVFSSADLRRADFTAANMSQARLDFAELQGASLDKAQLQGAYLSDAQLQGASFNISQLQGASFVRAGLKGASFEYARLQGAHLESAQLQGASFVRADLEGASLYSAELQGASFFEAHLRGTSLNSTRLEGAYFVNAGLQGASFDYARLQAASLENVRLQGASLRGAELQGASLDRAALQGASLFEAQLQGASLNGAQLQGASLVRAHLQGASLVRAQLQGASFAYAQLQGADLEASNLALSWIDNARLWRAKGAGCSEAHTTNPRLDAIVEFKRRPDGPDEAVQATPELIKEFIERAVSGIPDSAKDDVRKAMSARLIIDSNEDTAAIEKAWRDCANTAKNKQAEYEQKHSAYLRDLACKASDYSQFIANGIIGNWIHWDYNDPDRRTFSQALARGLLGLDGKPCPATEDLDERSKKRLHAVLALPPQ